MKELSQYVKYRVERLKKTDGLVTLSFFIIGVIIGTWKYGLQPTLSTIFIFFSAILFAEFISDPKFYLFRTSTKAQFAEGRKIFTLILLGLIVIIQFLVWDKFITIFSLTMGLTYGLIMFFLSKCR